ncbi:MAG: DUF3810 domain-containing protein [Oscillospiraceae bacterium]|jgi:hypothetical protein|nr:DUF3810 domain-containing protein [Oscillospiraceae bacterium]
MNKNKNRILLRYIFATGLPALLAALFFLLRGNMPAMTASRSVANYVRFALSSATRVAPFSVLEVAAVLLATLITGLLVKAVTALIRRNPRLALRRAAAAAAIVLWGISSFLWVWCSGYYAKPVYASGGLTNAPLTVEQLRAAAEIFLAGANECAPLVPRDANGVMTETAAELIKRAPKAADYAALRDEFPSLARVGAARVKPMIISKIMSRTGYTGIYFALTGEANVNADIPPLLLPATAAHELAHSFGVAPENQANFFGIVAAVKSGDATFRYSGYLLGLIELGNALAGVSPDDYFELRGRYGDLVNADLQRDAEYWEAVRKSTGNGKLDDAVTAFADAVDKTYDNFLVSQGQESGLRSYGECVNLLAEYFI